MLNNLSQLIYLIQAYYASQSQIAGCCEGEIKYSICSSNSKTLHSHGTCQIQKIFWSLPCVKPRVETIQSFKIRGQWILENWKKNELI